MKYLTLEKFLRTLLGLTFLPDKFRAWIFGTGTRFFETFNCVALLACGIGILFDAGQMFLLTPYRGFYAALGEWTDEAVGAAMLLAGVLAVIGLACQETSVRARMLGGYAMILSSMLWGLVAAGFIAGYPPLTTGMLIYAVMGGFGLFAGEHVIYTVKREGGA